MTLNESIIKIRVELQNAKLKKSGRNKFVGFDYFELADFLPKLNELMLSEGLNDRFYIKDDLATLEIQKGSEINTYTMPFVMFETPTNRKEDKDTGEIYEAKSMQDIQYLGALNTYYKRYLYLNAFGITDGEIIEGMNNDEMINKEKKEKLATPKQIEILLKTYKEDNLTKLLELNKLSKIEDITMRKASELIQKNIEKSKQKKEEKNENEKQNDNERI